MEDSTTSDSSNDENDLPVQGPSRGRICYFINDLFSLSDFVGNNGKLNGPMHHLELNGTEQIVCGNNKGSCTTRVSM